MTDSLNADSSPAGSPEPGARAKPPTKSYAKWRDAKRHLPAFLKTYEGQKLFFEMVHEITRVPEDDQAGLRKTLSVDVPQAHCYVIDRLLWCLARHGWTLQRSRANVQFDSLDAHLAWTEEHLMERRKRFYGAILGTGAAASEPEAPVPSATPAPVAPHPRDEPLL